MRTTIFLLGPSDIEGQSTTQIESTEGGKIQGSANWSGIMPIEPYVSSDQSLKANSHFCLLSIQQLRLSETGKHNFFNLVGDADASSNTLKKIEQLERETKPVRSFNRVSDVIKTSRSRIPKTLENIPRCRLPKVSAVHPGSYAELTELCDTFNKWPLIIRASGFHGSENMVLIENPGELESIRDEKWILQESFLIEYLDYKGEDNLYRKYRVMMIDGTPLPRHCIVSDQRFIHARNRSDLMSTNDGLCQQEQQFLDTFEAECLSEYGDVFKAIYQRIGLDVFGIDFTFVGNEMVIFEANACMQFLFQDFGENNRYRYLETPIKRLKRALKKMLMTA